MADLLNKQDWNEGGETLHLPGKTTEEFKLFYKALLISSWQPLTPSTALCLAKWANEYGVEALKAKCENVLCTQPVDGIALRYAVKYGLEKRTIQCINAMLLNIDKHIDDLKILISSEKHLNLIWERICCNAGLPEPIPLPPAEHVDSMWTFVGAAIRSRRRQHLEKEEGTCTA